MPSKRLVRTLLIAEFIIAFGPVFILLLIGLLLSVFQVVLLMFSAEARATPLDSLEIILLTVTGTLGLAGFANLAIAILNPSESLLDRNVTLLLGLFGFGGIIYLISDADTWAWRMTFLLPLVVAIHATYLGRGFLFPQLERDPP